MGVYHLMGLGLSAGTVTGPLSYLAHRYQRWNKQDQKFFARSGSMEEGKKAGAVQTLVLFTTSEVISGEIQALDYIDNAVGGHTKGAKQPRGPMKESLTTLLEKTWPAIAGGYETGHIFWCEVDRRDIKNTFSRVAQVIMALKRKEQWVNLTGGNNVINFALQLAASLSGEVARLYYVQAADSQEKCAYYTTEEGYWIDIPTMPLALSRVNRAILDLLTQLESLTLQELRELLLSEHGHLVKYDISTEELLNAYLTPMWKQGLISSTSDKTGPYTIGPQWDIIWPYREMLEMAGKNNLTIEELAEQEPWLEQQHIRLKYTR